MQLEEATYEEMYLILECLEIVAREERVVPVVQPFAV